jgi:predicted porin
VAVPVERITSAVSADYHLTENTMLTAGYRYRWSSYEEPQYRDTSHDIQAGLAADLGKHLPRVKGRLNTSYSRYLLPDSRTINVKGTIGFSYDVSETWSIFVDGGLRRTDSELFLDEWVPFGPDAEIKVREQRDNTAWGRVGQLSLNYKGEYTAAELLYIKDLTLASGLQAATDSDGLSLSARYRITYELSAFLTASYSMFRSDPAQGADHVIRQNNISISPSVRYDLSRNLTLEASYERTRINYLASNTEANRHAYFIRLSARFPRCSSSQYK